MTITTELFLSGETNTRGTMISEGSTLNTRRLGAETPSDGISTSLTLATSPAARLADGTLVTAMYRGTAVKNEGGVFTVQPSKVLIVYGPR